MSNRVNKTDFIPDQPFRDLSINHGQYHSTVFCTKCHWNPSWGTRHSKCDGKIISVPASIRFPKKKASKRTWKIFTEFLFRKPTPTDEELINEERQKKLNQILDGGQKYRKDSLKKIRNREMDISGYEEIPYEESKLEKLDFRGLIEDEYKQLVRDELLKDKLHLDYISTDKIITDTTGLTRATDEEIINAKRKIILNETI